jgi:predicted regulator of Ras-like GTPase activity (Roadblock/LC7/MglB family)
MRGADLIGSIGADDLERFQQLLSTYLTETHARCVVLVDRTGRLLATAGDTGGFDQISFASLAAADFAASDQLAALLGEPEFASLYHHGDRQSMFLADLGGWAILVMLFDAGTTLGLVRLRSRAALPRLVEVFEGLARREREMPAVRMDEGWAAEAEDEIDRLFGEE